MNKELLIENIKEWVKIDNEIRELRKQEKVRKDKQKELSKTLMETMKENDIDEFDIKQGKIMYKKKNVKKPITKKNLLEILLNYFIVRDIDSITTSSRLSIIYLFIFDADIRSPL